MNERKLISVLIPTYNEEGNILPGYERICKIFQEKLPQYDFEIVYIDNMSKDATRVEIGSLAEKDQRIKAIFNAKNFGPTRSTYYGVTQCEGDAVVLIYADMQDPPELIPDFIKYWEEGYQIVAGIKSKSRENPIVYLLRATYYWLIKKMANTEQIKQFTGYGLYDKAFIKVLRELDDPEPYMRGIVAELGGRLKRVEYTQALREHGKSSNNFFTLYDFAMQGITSYTKIGLRLVTLVGAFIAFLSLSFGLFTIVAKFLHWDDFFRGIAPITVVVCFMSAVQLFFMGLMGEYILSINTRILKRPLVIEEKRINW